MLILLALLAAAPPALILQRGHDADIEAVAASADGKWVATVSKKTLIIWAASSLRELRRVTLQQHFTVRGSLAFTTDSRAVLVTDDGPVSSWEVETGEPRKLPFARLDEATLTGFALLPGGGLVGAGKAWSEADQAKVDGVHLFGEGPPKLLSRFDARYLAASADGAIVVAGGHSAGARTIEVATGRELASVAVSNILRVSVSRDGARFAVAEFEKVHVFDARTGEPKPEVYGSTAAFSPARDVLATDYAVRDAAGNLMSLVSGNAAIAWSADGKVLYTASIKGTLSAVNPFPAAPANDFLAKYRTPSAEVILALPPPVLSPFSLAFADRGRALAVGLSRSTLAVWDLARGRASSTALAKNAWGTVEVALSPDGARLAAGVNDGINATAAGLGIQTEQHQLDFEIGTVTPQGYKRTARAEGNFSTEQLGFSPDGKRLFTRTFGIDKNTFRLFDAEGLKLIWSKDASKQEAAFDTSGDLLLPGQRLAAADGVVSPGSESLPTALVAGKPLPEPPGDWGKPTCFAIAQGGKWAAQGFASGWLRVLNGETGEVVRQLRAHIGDLRAVSISPAGDVVASAADDGGLRLHSLKTGDELAMLVVTGPRDWVVVAPDGRFDGTAAALQLIHYVQGTQVLPIEARFEKAFTPGLLGQLIAPPPSEAPKAEPIADVRKGLGQPPAARIVSPAAGATIDSPSVEVIVESEDRGGGVDEVRLFLNGKGVEDETRGVKMKSARRSFTVQLAAGANVLRAVAIARDRTEGEAAEVSVSRAATEAKATLHAVIVGLNKYKNAKYNLNYGRADAQAFLKELRAGGKSLFRKVIAHELYDAKATRESIFAALDEVAAAAAPQDLFVFFFAGHGTMSEGEVAAPAEFFLVPHDVTALYGNDAQLAARGVSARELRERATKVRAQKQLLILDACQAGGAVDAFAARGAAEEKALLQLARSAGVMVLASTGSQQFATEFGALGHGVFTYALLEGLRGAADGAPKDGKVTVKELEAFLGERVPELTQKHHGTAQYPNGYARGQDFPVGLVK